MSTKKKYQEVFTKSLSIETSKFNEDLKYNDIPEWDSIGHMSLISALEEEYKISLETDDIVDFSSFKKGIELLKKYKVNIV
jgi:acyl carrier protein